MKDNNNKSNQKNPNSKTTGFNVSYQKKLDNKSRQLNPNNSEYEKNKK